MKISTIVPIVGLMLFPVIGLAQTSTIQVSPIQSATTVTSTQTTETPTKCEVISFRVGNECGLGMYTSVNFLCSDGEKATIGDGSSCKDVDVWHQYANEACANRYCSNNNTSQSLQLPVVIKAAATPSTPTSTTFGGSTGGGSTTPTVTTATQMPATQTTTVPAPIPTPTILITPAVTSPTTDATLRYMKCGVNSFGVSNECGLGVYKNVHVQCYDGFETNLGASESSCKTAELWNQYAKDACANRCSNGERSGIVSSGGGYGTASTPAPAPTRPTGSPTVTGNKPVAVSIDRCNEVTQWENKIAYYKKLHGSGDDELKKNGYSREEIERIIQELSLGIEQVRAQCSAQSRTTTPSATITGPAFITETVRPVVIESGQEISDYYKAKLEKAVSAKGEEKQIQELKSLRDEIDGLISNLIKSRTELEVSELNSLVKEVKVSRGEIKADDISVKTTEKKMLVNIGDRPVSVEPTVNQVLIRDKGLEVNTNEVMIKENVLSVGGVDVKMSASEVTEKLGITPTTIELKEEGAKAVYAMKIDERRKLFGFIPFNSQKTVTADAENGNSLSEQVPWYNFLTTK